MSSVARNFNTEITKPSVPSVLEAFATELTESRPVRATFHDVILQIIEQKLY